MTTNVLMILIKGIVPILLSTLMTVIQLKVLFQYYHITDDSNLIKGTISILLIWFLQMLGRQFSSRLPRPSFPLLLDPPL